KGRSYSAISGSADALQSQNDDEQRNSLGVEWTLCNMRDADRIRSGLTPRSRSLTVFRSRDGERWEYEPTQRPQRAPHAPQTPHARARGAGGEICARFGISWESIDGSHRKQKEAVLWRAAVTTQCEQSPELELTDQSGGVDVEVLILDFEVVVMFEMVQVLKEPLDPSRQIRAPPLAQAFSSTSAVWNSPKILPSPKPHPSKELDTTRPNPNRSFPRQLRGNLTPNSMNLPPDKARILRQYDNEKKWELICDQKFRRRVQESTQVLRELEISLRTNHIGWVREFLNEGNKGLDVLVEYLSFAQYAVTTQAHLKCSKCSQKQGSLPVGRLRVGEFESLCICFSASSFSHIKATLSSLKPGLHVNDPAVVFLRSNTLASRRTLKNSRLVCRKDDVHVCIMCLRAIMNYQYGFNMVMSHPHAVNEIALSLNNKSPRTKALVLELLAAVCLVRGGHEIILSAFDHFKEVRKHNGAVLLVEPPQDKGDPFSVSCPTV
ncbi:hypothetical protein DNTS_005740, partial [Danionella cerebrum]